MLACICVVPFNSGICDTGDLVSSSPPFAPARAAFLSDDWHTHVDIDHQPHIWASFSWFPKKLVCGNFNCLLASPSNFWINWPASVSSDRSVGCSATHLTEVCSSTTSCSCPSWSVFLVRGAALCHVMGTAKGVHANPRAELRYRRHGKRYQVCLTGLSSTDHF